MPGVSSRWSERFQRYFPWILALSIFALVALTCWPVLAYPQLEPDDYRYLWLLEAGDGSARSLLERSIVENRWDHLWWIADRDPVRFWRPMVLASYWLDHGIWGDADIAFGLCFSNLLFYLGVCLVAGSLLTRLLGRRLETLLGALLFTGFFAHGEVIWYVAGRTDTIAALFFLLAFRLHLIGGSWRFAGAASFFLALITKELSIGLPLLLLVLDWVDRGEGEGWKQLARKALPWLACYVAAVILWLGLRSLALDGRSVGGASYPYFISPFGGQFLEHLWTQLQAYVQNLAFAVTTPPFLRYDDLQYWGFDSGKTWTALTLFLAVICLLARERRLPWLLLFLLGTWLPTSFVYVSERYLLLPSFAIAAMAGFLLRRQQKPVLRWVLLAVVLSWTGHQSYQLWSKNHYLSKKERPPLALAKALERSQLRPAKGSRLLFVNFPADLLNSQFLEAQLRVLFDDPTLSVRILSHQEAGGVPGRTPSIIKEGERSLVLRSQLALAGISPIRRLFPYVEMKPGQHTQRPGLGFRVEVLAGDGLHASDARFLFPRPVSEYEVWSFVPGARGSQGFLDSALALQRGRIVRERL
ncbi:MAG: hypothetical protein CSA62_13410 [Planctomycetota bacterium]|nr:MAG: hypothetical protein CSA62_13410 [Planctomycetota bacterium]